MEPPLCDPLEDLSCIYGKEEEKEKTKARTYNNSRWTWDEQKQENMWGCFG